MTGPPLSDPPGAPDIVAAVDVFDAAYRAHYLAAGDEWDHREALRAGLEAVLVWRRDQFAAERERHPLYVFAYVPTSGTVNAPTLPLPHAGSGDREEPAGAACATCGGSGNEAVYRGAFGYERIPCPDCSGGAR